MNDALSLSSVDMVARGHALKKILGVVKGQSVGLIGIMNTDLHPEHTRCDIASTIQPIRHDGLCDGLIIQFHRLLRTQELHSLELCYRESYAW